MLVYAHPLLAVLTLSLLAHVASLGVRARNDRRHRRRYLERHARLAPWMFGLVALTWTAGLTASWLLTTAEGVELTGHFYVGVALVTVLTAAAVTSRWMGNPTARAIHPWLGATALLLSAAQVFFGLQLLP